jgi:hypothetical protein
VGNVVLCGSPIAFGFNPARACRCCFFLTLPLRVLVRGDGADEFRSFNTPIARGGVALVVFAGILIGVAVHYFRKQAREGFLTAITSVVM